MLATFFDIKSYFKDEQRIMIEPEHDEAEANRRENGGEANPHLSRRARRRRNRRWQTVPW